MSIVQHFKVASPCTSLAPFYARARRRRIWRVLRWLLLIAGLIVLFALIALATNWLPF